MQWVDVTALSQFSFPEANHRFLSDLMQELSCSDSLLNRPVCPHTPRLSRSVSERGVASLCVSVAHSPKSINLQRAEQNGRDAFSFDHMLFLAQVGHNTVVVISCFRCLRFRAAR